MRIMRMMKTKSIVPHVFLRLLLPRATSAVLLDEAVLLLQNVLMLPRSRAKRGATPAVLMTWIVFSTSTLK